MLWSRPSQLSLILATARVLPLPAVKGEGRVWPWIGVTLVKTLALRKARGSSSCR